jgi:hypothetical protein
MDYSEAAVERAMKVHEVILRAMSGELTWLRAADILQMSPRSVRRWRWRLEQRAMKVLCAVNAPPVAQKILRHLGLPTEGPRCAPARGPPEPEFDFDIDQDTEPWSDDDGLELEFEDENLET